MPGCSGRAQQGRPGESSFRRRAPGGESRINCRRGNHGGMGMPPCGVLLYAATATGLRSGVTLADWFRWSIVTQRSTWILPFWSSVSAVQLSTQSPQL